MNGFREDRTCGKCGRAYPYNDPGQTPLRSGWCCGDCWHVYCKRVDARARELIAEYPTVAWSSPRHRTFEECWRCDVKRRISVLLLWCDGWDTHQIVGM